MSQSCSAVACFLERSGGLVSFPLVTIAGLVDGVNPCAIGMMLLLLGYLIVFAKKPERVLKTGILYIGTIYLTYLFIGLFFYRSLDFLNFTPFREVFNKILGSLLLTAGMINVKDWFYYQKRREFGGILGKLWEFHLEIPQKARPNLQKLVGQVSYPAVVILAVLVTLLETPCSLPLYLGTAQILLQSGLIFPLVIGYFLYYNFLFVLPLILILFLVWQGKELVALKEWEHKGRAWMKLSIGLLLMIMGIWFWLW